MLLQNSAHVQYPALKSTRFSADRPARTRSMFSTTLAIAVRGSVSAAEWGVIVTPGWVHSGESGGSGSVSNTSR